MEKIGPPVGGVSFVPKIDPICSGFVSRPRTLSDKRLAILRPLDWHSGWPVFSGFDSMWSSNVDFYAKGSSLLATPHRFVG